MVQRHADARAERPPGLQRPPAQRNVADVVDKEKSGDRDPPTAERDRGEGEGGQERQPACPHEPVAHRSERPAQPFAQPLDLIG